MQTYRVLLLALLATACMPILAQSEGGLIVGVEVEKKIDKKWSIGLLEVDMRSRNNFKTMDRFSGGVSTSYKFNKWLKADAGYKLLVCNNREKISYKTSGNYNHWRPSYWGSKHRLYASLTGSYKFTNKFRLSLRERWQYTYRPEETIERWDFDEAQWEDKIRAGKGKNQLRSRIELSYDKKRALLTPYVSAELYNSWAIEKVRYTAGTDIRLSKQHSCGVFYRFQDTRNTDESDYDPDMHYIGIEYKFKF